MADSDDIKNAIIEFSKDPNKTVTLSDGRTYTRKDLDEIIKGFEIVKRLENDANLPFFVKLAHKS